MRVLIGLFGFALLFGCNKDVDQLLLKGELVEYEFNNDMLEGVQVDEALIHQFTLESNLDGNTANIACVYLGDTSKITTDTVFLYMHGNSGHMNHYWQNIADIANYSSQHNYGVLMMDYRGFGQSEGTSDNIETMVADVEACASWLYDRGIDDSRLVLYGYSLGSFPAAHMAAYSSVSASKMVILEAPSTSADALIQDATGLTVTANTITDFGYDVPQALKDYKDSFLWLHGTEDQTAPYTNFLNVYNSLDFTSKQKFIVDGGSHSLVDDIGFSGMEAAILDYLRP